jgi:hypothetical protein
MYSYHRVIITIVVRIAISDYAGGSVDITCKFDILWPPRITPSNHEKLMVSR